MVVFRIFQSCLKWRSSESSKTSQLRVCLSSLSFLNGIVEPCSAVADMNGVPHDDCAAKLNLVVNVASLLFGYDVVFDGDTMCGPFEAHVKIWPL